MGGQIGLTIRMPDGTEHRMERWTNILPPFIYNPDFWDGNPHVWDETIQHWYTESAKKDAGETIISGWKMYEHPYLAPSEYGILVIDYKTMTIVSCQDYMSVNTIMRAEHETFDALKEKGFIGERIYTHGKTDELDEFTSGRIPAWDRYKIKQDKWTVHTFDYYGDQENALREAKELIESLGFEISDEEERIWEKRIVGREEE